MSNATFTSGAIGFDVAQTIEKFTLVALNADEKLVPATAAGPVFGAVTEPGSLNEDPRVDGNDILAVSYGQHAVKIRTDEDIKAGAAVFAADDGQAASTGTVQVGVAARRTRKGLVVVVLNSCPNA